MYVAIILVISGIFGGMAGSLFDWWGLLVSLPVAVFLGHTGMKAQLSR